ncbi:MAG: T9SS type A sorting domain-containing protein [Bacteroidota bacterium]
MFRRSFTRNAHAGPVLFLLFALLSFRAAAQPAAGDMGVIGWNANSNTIRIVTFVEIPANTVIKMTDNGWLASGSFQANTAADGRFTWTTGSKVAAGTFLEVTLATNLVTLTNITTNTDISGEVVKNSPSWSGADPIAATGDGWIIYRGDDSNPYFITAFNNSAQGVVNASGWNFGASAGVNTSLIPVAPTAQNSLENGKTAMGVPSPSSTYLVIRYNGAHSSTDVATWKSRLSDVNNYFKGGTSGSDGLGTKLDVAVAYEDIVVYTPLTDCVGEDISGTYKYTGMSDGKPKYEYEHLSIEWFEGEWAIKSANFAPPIITSNVSSAIPSCYGWFGNFCDSVEVRGGCISFIDGKLTSTSTCFGKAEGKVDFTLTLGKPPYTYVWSTGDTIHSSDSTLSLSNLAKGNYSLSVTDADHYTYLFSATVAEKTKIEISKPVNATILTGSDTSFAVSVSGMPQYNWQVSKAGQAFADVVQAEGYSGTGKAILGLTAVPFGWNGYRYRCVVTVDGCSATSDTALLTVTQPNQAPVIAALADTATCMDLALSRKITFTDENAVTASLSVSSSNQSVVKDAAIQVSGTDGTRTLTFTPEAGVKGRTTITITVTDELAQASIKKFVLGVDEGPVAARLAPIVNHSGAQGNSASGTPALTAEISSPTYVTVAPNGDVFFEDYDNKLIRKVSNDTLTNIGTTVSSPKGITTDRNGNVYFVDGSVIKKYDVLSGTVSNYAGAAGTMAADGADVSNGPIGASLEGIYMDNGDTLYIGVNSGARICKITPDKKVYTVAGTGTAGHTGDGADATAAQVGGAKAFVKDSKNNLYFIQSGYRVRKIDSNGIVSVFAGNGNAGNTGENGQASLAGIAEPCALGVDENDNILLFLYQLSGTRRVRAKDGIINTLPSSGANGLYGGAYDASTGTMIRTARTPTNRVYRYTPEQYNYLVCNKKPAFSPKTIANDTVCFSAIPVTKTKNIAVSDADGTISSTIVTSSDTNVVAVINAGTATAVSLTLTQKPNVSGSATIKLVSMDNLGAKDSISWTIVVNQLIATVQVSPASCFGGSNGKIEVIKARGGAAPYTYSWSVADSSRNVLANLEAGDYSLTVIDAKGCTFVKDTSVAQPAQLSSAPVVTAVSCNGMSDGKIVANVSGGTAPYSIKWSTGAQADSISGLSSGDYTLDVSDANQCKLNTKSLYVRRPEQISINMPASQFDVCSGETATFTATVNNALTYQWGITTDGTDFTALTNTADYDGVNTTALKVNANQTTNGTLYQLKASQSESCFVVSSVASKLTVKVCNVAPELGDVSNQLICQNEEIPAIPLSLKDEKPSTVTFSVSSSNAFVLAPNQVSITGSGEDRKIEFAGPFANPGTTIVKIIATDAGYGMLKDSVSFTIKVNNLPGISLSDFTSVCSNEAPFVLEQGIPVSGTYSGEGVENGSFNPATAGAGTHAITFSYTRPQTGCTNTITKNIEVKKAEDIVSQGRALCRNTAPFELEATPTGGTWSGAGVSDGKLDVSQAGVKPSATYTYTAANGCVSVKNVGFKLKDTVQVSLAPFADQCSNGDKITLTQGTPANGSYSGTGVADGMFDPALAGAGKHTITFSATENECTSTTTGTIVVNQATAISLPQSLTVCVNAAPVTISDVDPFGGTFSGTGIDGYTFDPESAGIGSHTITYTYDNGKCVSTEEMEIEVLAQPAVAVNAANDGAACEGSTVELSVYHPSKYTVFQWKKDGEDITGATDSAYVASQSGDYSVEVSGGGCFTTSTVSTVKIHALPVPTIDPSGGSFCSGDALVLSTQQFESYEWMIGSETVSTAASYSAGTAGSYTVTVVDANGCTGTSAAVGVGENSGPVITANRSTALCQGESVILSSNAAVSYQWYKDGGSIDGATAQTIAVTEPGSYIVVAIDNQGCTGTSVELVVSVKASPEVPQVSAKGDLEFCQGGKVLLETGSFEKFQWYNGTKRMAGANFASITVTESGEFSVVVTAANGCASVSEPVAVKVQALPSVDLGNVSYSNTFCSPATLKLGAKAEAATAYQWFRTNVAIENATASSYEVKETGLYQLKAISANGCEAKSKMILVNVKPSPEAAVITNTGVNILESSVADNLQWYKDGALIEGATSQKLEISENGVYSVVVSSANGCNTRSADFNVSNVSVSQLSSAGWSAFPNPFSNQLVINISEQAHFFIYDMTGRIVHESDLSVGENIINTSHLAKGVYHLRSIDNITPLTIRLLKQ